LNSFGKPQPIDERQVDDLADPEFHPAADDRLVAARIDAKKAVHDADVAERDAEWAEADALDAIDFASSAVEEAEYAVLDAMLARKDADVLAASS
jgi:hypothetical protein